MCVNGDKEDMEDDESPYRDAMSERGGECRRIDERGVQAKEVAPSKYRSNVGKRNYFDNGRCGKQPSCTPSWRRPGYRPLAPSRDMIHRGPISSPRSWRDVRVSTPAHSYAAGRAYPQGSGHVWGPHVRLPYPEAANLHVQHRSIPNLGMRNQLSTPIRPRANHLSRPVRPPCRHFSAEHEINSLEDIRLIGRLGAPVAPGSAHAEMGFVDAIIALSKKGGRFARTLAETKNCAKTRLAAHGAYRASALRGNVLPDPLVGYTGKATACNLRKST